MLLVLLDRPPLHPGLASFHTGGNERDRDTPWVQGYDPDRPVLALVAIWCSNRATGAESIMLFEAALRCTCGDAMRPCLAEASHDIPTVYTAV